jgi:hypothetical protein
MRSTGTPGDWVDLIDPFIPQLLDLVITIWETMPPLLVNAKENPTTNDFCRRLQRCPQRCEIPFHIIPYPVELQPATGEGVGEMDIGFYPHWGDEQIYFCLECKRLNVTDGDKFTPYTGKYVTEGMYRFVRGQYAAVVRHGGMLGYVLDGDVTGAIANIESNIRNHHGDLGMDPPGELLSSSIRPEDNRVRESHHRRLHNPELFHIHHLFMANVQPTPPV